MTGGRTTAWLVGLALPALVLALGCQTPLDRAWARSHNDYVERSIENPEAGTEDAPRLDGTSTENTMVKYRETELETDDDRASDRLVEVNID